MPTIEKSNNKFSKQEPQKQAKNRNNVFFETQIIARDDIFCLDVNTSTLSQERPVIDLGTGII